MPSLQNYANNSESTSKMSDDPDFTSEVTSSGMLNIPAKFQKMHEVEEGDLIRVEMKEHKKSNEVNNE